MVNDALAGQIQGRRRTISAASCSIPTVGFGGLLDPATSAGLDRNDEDFGLTLGHWGVHPGPFFELPILGPFERARRAGESRRITYMKPTQYIPSDLYGWATACGCLTPSTAAPRSCRSTTTIEQAFDPYAFIRDAYLSRRAYHVSDREDRPVGARGSGCRP